MFTMVRSNLRKFQLLTMVPTSLGAGSPEATQLQLKFH
jgi:hypothetical protein